MRVYTKVAGKLACWHVGGDIPTPAHAIARVSLYIKDTQGAILAVVK